MTTWKRPFVPAHRRKRDPLRKAQIAPVHTVAPVLCARTDCEDPWLIHRDGKECLRYGCECPEYMEVPCPA